MFYGKALRKPLEILYLAGNDAKIYMTFSVKMTPKIVIFFVELKNAKTILSLI